ncbi:hypothetical protein PUNSTDRAFT_64972 [Punctularia strigosozonata HHB-11173 SS5]|uniref:uncharacterized protein n=1 Tax=Punctularia strigosozonata (strain HHB-11173) TaxID=741275 RepID=UPI0004417858|nr:uncharacterized protein PUNSTDRAFT_64972 [Punctularia strigosozonata HHB-11173 SS5]EIN10457.1 hypothetical protein PUNSTDRAFT_64972 [Punctularia strigosozonata HHB-11173 SS5]
MFTSLGLFRNLPCPDANCRRGGKCLYSHNPETKPPSLPKIPLEQPAPPRPAAAEPSTSKSVSIPVKRPALPHGGSPRPHGSFAFGSPGPSSEPPRKLQKVGKGIQKPVPAPAASYTPTGAPVLRVSAAQSQVPVPVRQAMLKNLYEHFVVLYEHISATNPTLAADHALQQEQEVYNKSTKLTYRNAVISSIAALKKRPKPDTTAHPSVGTEGQVKARQETKTKLEALRLTPEHLEPLIMSRAEMQAWGYLVDIPPGPGGEKPSEEGGVMKCDRCATMFQVKRKDEAEQCEYHWGRAYSTKINGERMRLYSCCSRSTSDGGGCTKGPHVFYETSLEELHKRHAFSLTRRVSTDGVPDDGGGSDTALDVAALDCEMIYTTGGMRVARVSIVDGSGAEVFDEFVRMDEGVEVIDYNTRFSGVTAESMDKARLTLSSLRKSLDALINEKTILIGHALDNDLKTLRMIHHRCVDTAILFPHPSGPPYRKALRFLVKEHLGQVIQSGGGSVGHSSVEDSIATLDLVRWYILNRGNRKPNIPTLSHLPASSSASTPSATPSTSPVIPRTLTSNIPQPSPVLKTTTPAPANVVDLTMWD